MSKFIHQELQTTDPKAAKKFYKSLFGWKYQDMKMPEGVYTMISGADGGIGGISQTAPGVTPQWLGYATVPSVDKTTKKVVKAGGRVVMDKTEVPGMGSFAWYKDPQGVTFAVWEAAAPTPAPKKAAKKKAAKKKAAKKAAPKKAAKKKAAPKKAAKKKAAPKKAAKKKAAPKKKAAKKKATKKK